MALAFAGGFGLTNLAVPDAGVRAKYFSNQNWSGPPVLTVVDRDMSTDVLAERTRDYLYRFSVQWSGYLVVHHPGIYRFSTVSDDGSDLAVDDRVIVRNLGAHGPQEASSQIELTRGVHALYVRYSQEGGPFTMSVRWAPIGEPPQPVDPRLLLADETTYTGYWLRAVAPYAGGAAAAWLLALGLRLVRRFGVSWRGRRAGALAGRGLAMLERPGPAIAVIVVVGVVVRALLMMVSDGILWPDSGIFYYTAQALLNGRLLEHDAFRTALYPVFLSAFLRFGDTPQVGVAIIGAQHALGVAAAVLFYLVGRRAFTPLVALGGALLFSVHTIELFYEDCVLSEVLFVFALSVVLWAMVHLANRPTWLAPVGMGVLCGVLTLVRPVAQGFAICVAPILFMSGRRAPRAAFSAVAVAAVTLAVLAPWMSINKHEYGFWGVSIGRGLGLFTRVFEIDQLPPPAETQYPEVREVFDAGVPGRWGANNVRDELNYKRGHAYREVDESMFGFAMEAVAEHPLEFAANSVREWAIQLGGSLQGARSCRSIDGAYLCSGRTEGFSLPAFPNAARPGRRTLRSLLVSYVTKGYVRMPVVLAIALLGVLSYFSDARRRTPAGWLLALTIAYYTLIPAMLEWPQDRYRLPVDALLFMFAAWGLRAMFGLAGQRDSSPPLARV